MLSAQWTGAQLSAAAGNARPYDKRRRLSKRVWVGESKAGRAPLHRYRPPLAERRANSVGSTLMDTNKLRIVVREATRIQGAACMGHTIAPDLVCVVVLDEPDRLSYVAPQDLANTDLTPKKLHQIAAENTFELLGKPERVFHQPEPGSIMTVRENPLFESSRLCNVRHWRPIAQATKGDLLVAARTGALFSTPTPPSRGRSTSSRRSPDGSRARRRRRCLVECCGGRWTAGNAFPATKSQLLQRRRSFAPIHAESGGGGCTRERGSRVDVIDSVASHVVSKAGG
jgi:hypothetical protein